ncbi:MAG: hypothetical protein KIT84_01470 [Labilithrix sp.]|nr:hypothetical protein [Labilithrix sp.]MCW5809656.1 hypothetical protein [Labilithrix sp.]
MSDSSASSEGARGAHLAWAKGGTAELVSLADDAIVLRSTTPAPPGARLEATFEGRAVKIKSHGTHKEADGSFTLKGRLVDANRELRDALARVAQGVG